MTGHIQSHQDRINGYIQEASKYSPPLYLNNVQLKNVECHKHLEITFKRDLTWNVHIQNLILKGTKIINILKGLQYSLQWSTLEIIYFSYIRPLFEYGSFVWDGCTETEEIALLKRVQFEAARVVAGILNSTS